MSKTEGQTQVLALTSKAKSRTATRSKAKKAAQAPATQEQVSVTVPPTPPVAPVTQEATPAPAPRKITHYIACGRPSAGDRLYAHTAVVLEAFGMLAGGAIPTDTAKAVMGDTAVRHHKAKGNFQMTSKGLVLSPEGITHFSARAVNPEYKAAYEAVLIDGQTNETAGVKNPAFVKKL